MNSGMNGIEESKLVNKSNSLTVIKDWIRKYADKLIKANKNKYLIFIALDNPNHLLVIT
jgi:hypothetical protein